MKIYLPTKAATVIIIAMTALGNNIHAATWSGGGTNGNWSTAANWDSLPANGDNLIFSGTTGQNNTNDLLTSVGDVTFSTSGWAISGNLITLTGDLRHDTQGIQRWSINTYLAASPKISCDDLYGELILDGILSGTGGINKDIAAAARGTLTISGTNNSYTGKSNLGTGITKITKLANAGNNSSLGSPTGSVAVISIGNSTTAYPCTLSYIGKSDSITDRPLHFEFRYNNMHTIRNDSPTDANLSFVSDYTVHKTYSGTNTLTLAGTSTGCSSIAGNIPDSNLLKLVINCSGTWILSGTNSYRAGTTVEAGTLIVNTVGASGTGTGSVTVASGAALGGTGTLSPGGSNKILIESGGKITAGDSAAGTAGTLTINGDLRLEENSKGTFIFAPGINGTVAVSGTLTLPTNTVLNLTTLSGTLPKEATIFSAGTLAGATDISQWRVTGTTMPCKAYISGNSVIVKPITTDWMCWTKISFDGYTGSAPLTNFPVLIVFDPAQSNIDYTSFRSSQGYDLRFSDSTAESNLIYEIESWDPAGKSYVWVRIPQLTADTVIWSHWGAYGDSSQPSYSTDGSTWTNGFKGVWHMTEKDAEDSTANGYDGIAVNQLATTNSIIGSGLYFDGDGDFLNIQSHGLTLTNDSTFSAWVNLETTVRPDRHGIIGWAKSNYDNYLALNNGDPTSRYTLEDSDNLTDTSPTFNYTSNEWLYVTVSLQTDGHYHYYTNGSPISLSGNVRSHLKLGYLGAGYGGANPGNGAWEGGMDEVRLSSEERSDNWIMAAYRTMGDNSSFTVYGDVSKAAPKGFIFTIQ